MHVVAAGAVHGCSIGELRPRRCISRVIEFGFRGSPQQYNSECHVCNNGELRHRGHISDSPGTVVVSTVGSGATGATLVCLDAGTQQRRTRTPWLHQCKLGTMAVGVLRRHGYSMQW